MNSFDDSLPLIVKVTFSFPEFVSPCKRSIYSINSFLRCSQFYGPGTMVAILIFDHSHPNFLQSTFNFREFVSVCKKLINSNWNYFKSNYFILLLWRYICFKNPVIWLGKSTLTHISGIRFFLNIECMQEFRK